MTQPETAGGRVGVVAVDNRGRRQARRLSALAAVLVAAALATVARTPPASGAIGDITTAAGNGTAGYSGDGGPANAAQLNGPNSVAVDLNGDVLIADWSNNAVRRVDHTTGVISTIAGNGTGGFSGDGGPATSAQLANPYSVGVDAQNNVLIADWSNHRLRKVDHITGIITTLAGSGAASSDGDGGLASAAGINGPTYFAYDAAGNLYLGDYFGRAVRKIDTAGIITTVAGQLNSQGYGGDGGPATSATLGGPVGIELDAGGDLFIADADNSAIRKVDHATGVITTVAGGRGAGYSGDGGPAIAAELNFVNGLAFDGSGNLLIADYPNHVVRLVNPAGNIFTIAGTGTSGYTGDGGPANTAQLGGPADVALDASGNIYIADYDDNVIRVMTGLDPSVTTTTMPTTTVPTTTTTIPALPSATVFPVPENTPLYPGSEIPTFEDVATGGDGNVWFSRLDPNESEYNTELGRITPDGQFLRPFAVGHDHISGLTRGGDGNIWFVEFHVTPEYGGASVGRVTPDGQVTRFTTCGQGDCLQRFVTTGPDGNVWFPSVNADGVTSIDRITPQGELTAFPLPQATCECPAVGITAGPDGAIWFTLRDNTSVLGRITTSGAMSILPITGGGLGGIGWDLAAGPDGLLWGVDRAGDRLKAFTADPVSPQMVANFSVGRVNRVKAGPDGMYFTLAADGKTIGRATTAGYALSDAGAAGFGQGLAQGPDGNMWALVFPFGLARVPTPGPKPVLPKAQPVAVPHGPTISGEICPPFDTNANPRPGTTINGNVDVIDNTYGCLLMNATVNGNVHVVDGAYADLEFTTVNGQVIVDSGGEVTMANSRVTGGVVGTDAGFVNVWSTRVDNGLVINGARNGLTYLCGSTVNGGVTVSGVTDGTFPDLLGDPSHHCPANRINGGLTLTNNQTQAVLNGNTVNGQIRCTGNTPAPTGSGNSGRKSGQCSSV